MTIRIEAAEGARVRVDGRWLVSFAGCDSLGLARHPSVVQAAHDALDACGVSASASRTTTGTWEEHAALERELADWFGAEDAVVLPSGWMAGQVLVAALARRARALLLDDRVHPALELAAQLTGLPTERYAHFDADAAARAGERLIGMKPLILTDGIDATTGRVAPLAELAEAAEQLVATLVVDDAYAVGVLGGNGRGTAERCGVEGPDAYSSGTLSKALGAHGGFFTGTRAVCDAGRADARVYAGATPLPPAIAAAARCGVELARDGGDLRTRLAGHAAHLGLRFDEIGIARPERGLPWFAIADRPSDELAALCEGLRTDGFLVPHLRYFGAPTDGLLKIALSAAHTDEDVERLAESLARRVG